MPKKDSKGKTEVICPENKSVQTCLLHPAKEEALESPNVNRKRDHNWSHLFPDLR